MDVIDGWPRSRSLWDRAPSALGGGVSSGMRARLRPHPLYFTRGREAHLTDVDGHDYVDHVLGWGPGLTGHAHPHVVEAVRAQVARGQAFGAGHEPEVRLAERVAAAIPGVERVLWSNTGTEANLLALRLARARTGRLGFVKFTGHYHGWSDEMLVGYRPNADGAFEGITGRGQDPAAARRARLVEWNDLDGLRQVLTAPGADIAAVVCEPVLCNSGVLAPADGFLAGVRALCDETGTVLVLDEVITGFRVSYGGATELFGVRPDLVVLGKAFASGFPLAAVAGRADIVDLVTAGVVHAGTYNGNGAVIAAGNATLDVLQEPGTYTRLARTTRTLADGLSGALRARGVVAAVNAVTGVVQVALGRPAVTTPADYLACDWAAYDRLSVALLRRGVFVLPGGRYYLSTAHTHADLRHTVAAFTAALEAS